MTDFISTLFQKHRHRESHEHALLPSLPKYASQSRYPALGGQHVAITATATDASPLFRRLPAEIRTQILMEAFGGRIMHMDFSLTHPLEKRASRSKWPHRRHNKEAQMNRGMSLSEQRFCHKRLRFLNPGVQYKETWDFEVQCDCERPIEWRWVSCVCETELEALQADQHYMVLHHSDCYCRVILMRPHCRNEKVVTSQKNHIGIAGWLRTCRQAYLEGVDILYKTNMFIMSGTVTAKPELVLLRHLPGLLPAYHLLRTVKVSWCMQNYTTDWSDGPNDVEREDFKRFLQLVPQSLPNVKTLYIDIDGLYTHVMDMWETVENFERSKRAEIDIFLPVDDMFRKMSHQLTEFCLGVPATIFRHRFDAGTAKGLFLDPIMRKRFLEEGVDRFPKTILQAAIRRERVWRRLPLASKELTNSIENQQGYWIQKSVDDQINIQYCFGSGAMMSGVHHPHPATLDPD